MGKKNPVQQTKRQAMPMKKVAASFDCASGSLRTFNPSKAYDMMLKAEAEYMNGLKKD